MTRVRRRLKRLEDVIAPASAGATTITVQYVDVSGNSVDAYRIVMPSRLGLGLASWRRQLPA
jgi:hypothetical protein